MWLNQSFPITFHVSVSSWIRHLTQWINMNSILNNLVFSVHFCVTLIKASKTESCNHNNALVSWVPVQSYDYEYRQYEPVVCLTTIEKITEHVEAGEAKNAFNELEELHLHYRMWFCWKADLSTNDNSHQYKSDHQFIHVNTTALNRPTRVIDSMTRDRQRPEASTSFKAQSANYVYLKWQFLLNRK